MAPGRNAPCPCGSGKKYKKCCLPKEQQEAHRTRTAEGGAVDALRTLGISRHQGLRLAHEEMAGGRMSKSRSRRVRDLWTPQKVSAMDTDEILERLRAMGVEVDERTFPGLTEGLESGWALSETWANGAERRLDDRERDFLGLAAVNLWRRWVPHRPCVEAIDDWMQEGYQMDADQPAAVVANWWVGLWELLCRRARQEGVKTTDELDSRLGSTQHVGNWLQDMGIAFLNASMGDPKMAWRGAEALGQVVETFPGEGSWLGTFMTDRAELLFRAGRRDLAEPILRRQIDEEPKEPAAYMRLAEGLTDGDDPAPEDVREAIDLLEHARARCEEADNYGAADLLERLREKLASG
jgi:hypothetical protein